MTCLRLSALAILKDRFGARVVARSPHADALLEAAALDEGAEGGAHVLAATIAVEDRPREWATTLERARARDRFPARYATRARGASDDPR